jgi:hypothetical protein
LNDPPILTDDDWRHAPKGRVPGTQTPPKIDDILWNHLAERAASHTQNVAPRPSVSATV